MGLHKKDADAEESRTIDFGRAEHHPPFADNSVTTSKYTVLSFFPLVSRLILLKCCLQLSFICKQLTSPPILYKIL